MPVRTALVPAHIKRLHAHRRAVEQFLAQNLHTTAGHTGVLIFVSVAERYAEILADTRHRRSACRREPGSDRRRAHGAPSAWQARPTGWWRRSAPSGAHLAAISRPRRNPNELPDHLIVLP